MPTLRAGSQPMQDPSCVANVAPARLPSCCNPLALLALLFVLVVPAEARAVWDSYRSSRGIHSIAVSRGGAIWLATDDGILVLKQDPASGMYAPVHYYSSQEGAPVWGRIALRQVQQPDSCTLSPPAAQSPCELQGSECDAAGVCWSIELWIGGSHFDARSNQWAQLVLPNNMLMTNDVIDTDGNLWIASSFGDLSVLRGVVRLDVGTNEWTTFATADSQGYSSVTNLASAADGGVWDVSNSAPLELGQQAVDHFSAATGQWTSYTSADGFLNGYVTDIAGALDGRIWLAIDSLGGWDPTRNEAGISYLDPPSGLWTNYPATGGLQEGHVQVVAPTAGGGVWVGLAPTTASGTWNPTGGGASYLNTKSGKWSNYTQANGVIDSQVDVIAIDPKDGAWLGTPKGLSHYDTTAAAWTSYTVGEAAIGYARAAVLGADGKLWFATNTGAVQFDPDTSAVVRYRTQDGIAGDSVISLASAPSGSLWFATDGGISSFEPGTALWTTIQDCATLTSQSTCTSARNCTWIGGQTPACTGDGPSSQAVRVAVANNGTVWFLTYDSLGEFDPAANVWASQLLPSPSDYYSYPTALTTGPDGTVWMGTIYSLLDGTPGAGHFDPATSTWTVYPASSALDAIALAPDGQVWFGTDAGIARLDPATGLWTPYEGSSGDIVYGSAIRIEPDGTIWRGDVAGLHRLEVATNTWTHYRGDGLGAGEVIDILLSGGSSMWVLTTENAQFEPSVLNYYYPVLDKNVTQASAVKNAVQIEWALSPEAKSHLDTSAGGSRVYRSLSANTGYEALHAGYLSPCSDGISEIPCVLFDDEELPAGITRYYRIGVTAQRRVPVLGDWLWSSHAEYFDRDKVFAVRVPGYARFTVDASEPAQSGTIGETVVYDLELRSIDGYTGPVTLSLASAAPAGLEVTLPTSATVPGTAQVYLRATDYAQLAECDVATEKRCVVALVATGPNTMTADPTDTIEASDKILLNVTNPALPSERFLTHYFYGAKTKTVDEYSNGAREVEQVVEVAQAVEVRGRLYPAVPDARITTWFTEPVDRGGATFSVWSLTDAQGSFSHTFVPPKAGRWSVRSEFDPDGIANSGDEVTTDAQPHLSPPDLDVARARTSTTLQSDQTIDTQVGDTVTISGRLVPYPLGESLQLDAEVRQPDGSYAFLGQIATDATGAYAIAAPVKATGYMHVVVRFLGDLDYRDSAAEMIVPIQQGVGMAIVVAGAGETSPLFPSITMLSDMAVKTLRRRNMPDDGVLGSPHNRINYLFPDAGHDVDGDAVADVDALPSLATLSAAITSWAPLLVKTTLDFTCAECPAHGGTCIANACWYTDAPEQTPLTVYLIGDAANGAFRIDGTESIDGLSLDGLLDAFEQAVRDRYDAVGMPPPATVPVTVVVDSPSSGDFILPISGPGRVVLTSTTPSVCDAPNPANCGISYMASGGSISFSSYFLSRIAAGQYIHPSYAYARLNILANGALVGQDPQLEATGEGAANEIADELLTASMPLEYRPVGDARPRLQNALGQIALRNLSAAQLWVYVDDPEDAVSTVEAVVVPPGVSFEEADVVTMFESPTKPNRWEGQYDKFAGEGLYTVVYTAMDVMGNVADPLVKTVIVADTTPPLEVTGLQVIAISANSVTVKWLPSESLDTQGYRLYVTSPGGSEVLWADLGNVDTATIDGLGAVGTYTFRVAAYDRVPLESAGAVIEADVTGACTSLPEVCDGIDNDCNGIADDGGDALCDDALACNGIEACLGAAGCAAGEAVDCSSMDGTCVQGSCAEPNGACVAQAVANGTPCDDGNACTQTDSCNAGICQGAEPISCLPQGMCRAGGECNPATGLCSDPPAVDGTTCDDGNACTQTDRCLSGVCAGSSPVDCLPQGVCRSPGVCDPATGMCSNPPAPDGTACSDGLSCTTNDRCSGGACGGELVDCSALGDACHTGICSETLGGCTSLTRSDGSTCDDGLRCTQGDQCSGGVCAGVALDCSALSGACVSGVCDESSGTCTTVPRADGTACEDGAYCTTGETCLGGSCQGGQARTCSAAAGACRAGVCDEATDKCNGTPLPDGTACDDGQFCTTGDACTAGECVGAARDCAALDDACGRGICNEAAGECQHAAITNGTPCDDGLFCTVDDTCLDGTCRGAPRSCDAEPGTCLGSACDEGVGGCSTQPEADGSWCVGGTCVGGSCEISVICTDGAVRACGLSRGACAPGLQECINSDWTACAGGTQPQAETCDGVDNDCDGLVDNVDADGDGADGCGTDCDDNDAAVSPQATEDCGDGKDNDCDGDIDAADSQCAVCADGAVRPCGTSEGACAEGSQACISGTWQACANAVGPSPEICDGVDNNCDGQVDEGCAATGEPSKAGRVKRGCTGAMPSLWLLAVWIFVWRLRKGDALKPPR